MVGPCNAFGIGQAISPSTLKAHGNGSWDTVDKRNNANHKRSALTTAQGLLVMVLVGVREIG